jgi:hypothetical protein
LHLYSPQYNPKHPRALLRQGLQFYSRYDPWNISVIKMVGLYPSSTNSIQNQGRQECLGTAAAQLVGSYLFGYITHGKVLCAKLLISTLQFIAESSVLCLFQKNCTSITTSFP